MPREERKSRRALCMVPFRCLALVLSIALCCFARCVVVGAEIMCVKVGYLSWNLSILIF